MNQDQNNYIPQDNNINQVPNTIPVQTNNTFMNQPQVPATNMSVQPTTPVIETNSNQPKKSNKIIIIVIGILIVVICAALLLTVFSKKDSSSNTNNSNNTTEESTNNKTQNKYNLVDYEDPEFKYTMKSLDVNQNSVGGNRNGNTSFWSLRDESYDDFYTIYYSEYYENVNSFPKDQPQPTDPNQIVSYFSKYVEKMLSSNKSLHTKDVENKTFKYESIKINGLDAVKFKDTLKCDDEKNIRDYGFTGVAVLGKKRSYLFWAIDLTEDMSRTDEALDIILEALKDFKEGE